MFPDRRERRLSKEDNPKEEQSSSLEEIPDVLHIDITPEFYQLEKERILKRQQPLIRGYLRDLFAYYKSLEPDAVIDAIESGETIMDRYETANFQDRVQLAAARGYLRVAPEKTKRRAKEIITLSNAMMTLRFENPIVYQVIKTFGEKGEDWLEQNTADLQKMLKLEE